MFEIPKFLGSQTFLRTRNFWVPKSLRKAAIFGYPSFSEIPEIIELFKLVGSSPLGVWSVKSSSRTGRFAYTINYHTQKKGSVKFTKANRLKNFMLK